MYNLIEIFTLYTSIVYSFSKHTVYEYSVLYGNLQISS